MYQLKKVLPLLQETKEQKTTQREEDEVPEAHTHTHTKKGGKSARTHVYNGEPLSYVGTTCFTHATKRKISV